MSWIAKQWVSSQVKSITGQTEEREGGVDWTDYNYPPGLNILHYNINDVEDQPSRRAVLTAHYALIGTTLALLLNLAGSIGISAGNNARNPWIALSLLNLPFLSALALWGFHSGYKGLAIRNQNQLAYFATVYSILITLSIIAATVDGAFLHGLATLQPSSSANNSSGPGAQFWLVWSYIEGIFWLLVFCLNTTALALVLTNRSHSRPTKGTRAGGMQAYLPGARSSNANSADEAQRASGKASSGPSNPLRTI